MKAENGELVFEEGDVLNFEDSFGNGVCEAKRGRDCDMCFFGDICNPTNPRNVVAAHCKKTHFELVSPK